MKLCIFAGTVEGRSLGEWLAPFCDLTICVATEYGGLLDQVAGATLHVGRMDEQEMEAFFTENHFETVIDATHPYAVIVSENISHACESLGVEYVRLERETDADLSGKNIIYVESAKAAGKYLEKLSGNIFLTTGVKELSSFSGIEKERLFARIIPSLESLQLCLNYIEPGHIIAALGPFSEETNIANLHSTNAAYLVTKQSGVKGGYPEKISAAMKTGVTCIVIGRPKAMASGKTEEMIRDEFAKRLHIEGERILGPELTETSAEISILGCGSGTVNTITQEALQILSATDCLIGSERLIENLHSLCPKAQVSKQILPDKITEDALCFCRKNRGRQNKIAILMSGDTGFYSGTKKLTDKLTEGFLPEIPIDCRIYPGISSISLLAARTGVAWDDAYLGSMHGRDLKLEEILKENRKLILLTDGNNNVPQIAKRLTDAGFGQAKVTVGSELGTDREYLVSGRAEEMIKEPVRLLSVVLIEINM